MPTLDGCHPDFKRRVEGMIADPLGRRLGLYLVSGFRSDAEQRRLWADALRRYGSAQRAAQWVAPPGRSRHGPRVRDDGSFAPAGQGRWGCAADLGVRDVVALSGQWPAWAESAVNGLAAKYGLWSPMDWEDWHFEPAPGRPLRQIIAKENEMTPEQQAHIDLHIDNVAKDLKIHMQEIRDQLKADEADRDQALLQQLKDHIDHRLGSR